MTADFSVLAAVVEALDVGVVFADEENVIRVFSRAAGEMLREDPAARLGTSILACHRPSSETNVLARVAGLRDGPETPRRSWLNYRGRDLRETLTGVRDAEGRHLGTLLVLHDTGEHVACLRRLGEWTELPVSGEAPGHGR